MIVASKKLNNYRKSRFCKFFGYKKCLGRLIWSIDFLCIQYNILINVKHSYIPFDIVYINGDNWFEKSWLMVSKTYYKTILNSWYIW